MNSYKNRKLMFKSPRATPPWKDVYRKKCFERLRSRRANLIEQFRFPDAPEVCHKEASPMKLVKDVMEIEWSAIHQSKRFPSLSTASAPYSGCHDSEEEEMMRETLLEIQSELHSEGELLLNDIHQYHSKELQSRVAMFLEEEVICPVCKIRKLEEKKTSKWRNDTFHTPPKCQTETETILRCPCGLSLSGPDLTLNRVHSALRTTIGDHGSNCSADLAFTKTEDSAGTNVLITCPSCDWMTFLV